MPVAVGIDLGTTYSSIAVLNKSEQIDVIANGQGSRVTQSIVAFPENGHLIGNAAKLQLAINAKNTIFGIKRIIGRSFNDPVVQLEKKNWDFSVVESEGITMIEVTEDSKKKKYYPEEISTIILHHMMKMATEFVGEKVYSAVITVPAHFNDAQRSATKDAASIAGLYVLAMINEPTAAALAYAFQNKIKGKRNVLVFDFGGGTFDVTLMKINDKNFDVIGTDGDSHLGGEDITDLLLNHCVVEFRRQAKKDFKISSRAKQRLRGECEEAKILLSAEGDVRTSVSLSTEHGEFDYTLTRATLEHLSENLFSRTFELVKQVLEDAKMDKTQVQDVVLVGGSSRIPYVQNMLVKFFGKEKIRKSINADEAVAYGAAVHAASFSDEYIAKQVYEGEKERCKDNNFLGTFKLTGIPPKPAGEVAVEVTYKIDSGGVLHVSATEKEAGKQQNLSIQMDGGRMSKREIKRLHEEAEKQRRGNEELKTREKAMYDFETYVHNVRSKIQISQFGQVGCRVLSIECDSVQNWICENWGASTAAIGIRKSELDAMVTKCSRKSSEQL